MSNENKFAGKAENYAAARPAYAEGLLDFLYTEGGLGPDSVIADIGSGTGKLSAQLLARGSRVIGVEPNGEMRRKAEEKLADRMSSGTFQSVAGTAENTGLADGSADAVTAAQAFHWFDPEAFRKECDRIRKPGAPVFLIWNQRNPEYPVNQAWRDIFRKYADNFIGFNNGLVRDDDRIRRFFTEGYQYREFENPLHFSREMFLQRLLSSSYAPMPGQPRYEEFLRDADRIFAEFCDGETITVPHVSAVYWN